MYRVKTAHEEEKGKNLWKTGRKIKWKKDIINRFYV